MSTHRVYVEAEVEVTVNDVDAIERTKTDEWRRNFYRFPSEQDVIDHFAFNCVANGVEDASRLDGWADMPRGAVTMLAKDWSL